MKSNLKPDYLIFNFKFARDAATVSKIIYFFQEKN